MTHLGMLHAFEDLVHQIDTASLHHAEQHVEFNERVDTGSVA